MQRIVKVRIFRVTQISRSSRGVCRVDERRAAATAEPNIANSQPVSVDGTVEPVVDGVDATFVGGSLFSAGGFLCSVG
jgi:hypothetical protein